MGPEVIALFVPIVSMLVIGGVIVAYYYFRHKSRTALQETLRQALDKGAELTPELLEQLAGPRPGPDADLRKALIWSAVGIGFICLGLFIPEEDAEGALAGVGTFPLLIGVAYFVMWKFTGDKKDGD